MDELHFAAPNSAEHASSALWANTLMLCALIETWEGGAARCPLAAHLTSVSANPASVSERLTTELTHAKQSPCLAIAIIINIVAESKPRVLR
jgi:hypothetical protein